VKLAAVIGTAQRDWDDLRSFATEGKNRQVEMNADAGKRGNF
jgi:hypothetical protein